jgi:tripartite-type tricarboxylate transporter receptor subunit TctC
MTSHLRILAASALALFACGLAVAQTDYPSSPVRIVYPYTAGGSGDALVRVFADKFSTLGGQQFFVDNKPGAGGNIGFGMGARATPDGYTLTSISPAFAINASLYASPGYDPIKDFIAVAPQSVVPNVMLVPADSPFKTVKDFVAAAKTNPGKYNFGSSGIGTSVHMAGELLKYQTGINLVHVPYRGAANAGTDLLGGRLDMMFDSAPSALANLRTGRARALAIASKERLPEMPDVPTMAEAGLPDFVSEAWTGMAVPASTPAPIVDKLFAIAVAANNDRTVVERLAALGGRPFTMKSKEEFADFIKAEVARNAILVKAAGLHVE